MRYALYTFAFIVVALPTLRAQEKWTIDDVLLAEHASGWQISPDGQHAVWVKRAMDKDKNAAISHLVLTNLGGKADIELTRGPDSCDRARWSPDGQRIAFLSSRSVPKAKADDDDKDDAKTRLWVMNPFGGEPWPITEGPREVRDFGWIDHDTLVVAAQEKATHHEKTLKDKKDTAELIEDELREPPVRLFKVSVKSKKSERLTNNADRIQSLFVSPDGKWAVTIHERSLSYTFDHKIKPVVFLYDLVKDERKPIFADKPYNVNDVQWTRDSKGFYAVSAFTSHPRFLMAYVQVLYHFDLADGKPASVPLDWANGLTDGGDPNLTVTPDGFIALLADGVRPRAARYVRKGRDWKRQWLEGEHARNLFGVHVTPDAKTLLYLHSTASSPNRWHQAQLAGSKIAEPKALTTLEPDFSKKTIAKTEIVRWKGALDEQVEGILYYPHDYAAGKKYALIVQIHGGPAGADFDSWTERWAYPTNLFCARGAFVFKPNYHGSTNYGLKFAESIADGKYYDLPVVDIEKGIDALVTRGLVDDKKIALSGWSNGAILTMALIVRSPRYAAAAAGAGGSEWVADWGACEFGMSFSNYYLGKSPLEDPQVYFKNAPFYEFAKVRTPTLLFHGSLDRVVPSHHGWLQYRALQQLGKTDVRFLQFPDEKHSLKKLGHQRRKVEEELAWFDRYLFKTHKAENEAIKADSPLALALERSKIKRDAGRYGISHKGVLIPETVAHEDLKVKLGRFEVTRAQYAEFDKKYAIDPGTANYPANGITLENAKAYCVWLSKETGETYRLGLETELGKLYEDASEKENTLDFWAGYAINPEDASRLQEKVKALPGKTPLLKEVGSFKGVGKEAIFDLGGNVAEWVLDKTGQKGVILGASADTPADRHALHLPAAPEYVGFRVVHEKAATTEKK